MKCSLSIQTAFFFPMDPAIPKPCHMSMKAFAV